MGCDGKGVRTKSNNHNFKNGNFQKPSWGGWISAYIYSIYVPRTSIIITCKFSVQFLTCSHRSGREGGNSFIIQFSICNFFFYKILFLGKVGVGGWGGGKEGGTPPPPPRCHIRLHQEQTSHLKSNINLTNMLPNGLL